VAIEPPSWMRLDPEATNFWHTLGYRRLDSGNASVVIEWEAGDEYSFPDPTGDLIVHGGLVTALLDTAMGGACASSLGDGERFLTADLRAEFFRPARPGRLRAEGRVVHRTRSIAYCAADLTDPEGRLVASSRCTQIVRSGEL